MELTIHSQPDNLQVMMTGPFTFSHNQKFAQIITLLESSPVQSLALNMQGVEFIDSAGLGMLLLLRDQCERKNVDLCIQAIRGQVQKIFILSKFDQLFTLKP